MTFTHAVVSLLLVLWMPLAPSPTQTVRQPKQYTIEQFLNTTSISGASFSADESRILFSSNKTGIWNAYTIPVTGGNGSPSRPRRRIPLTASPSSRTTIES